MRSLLELTEVHAGLRELFAIHRDPVVGLELSLALEALEDFERRLRAHMDAEEKFILPLYEKRVGHVPGGEPQFFHLEHRNILKNLEKAKEGLRCLITRSASGRRPRMSSSRRKPLPEHHDLREKTILYPRLTETLSPAEVEETLARCGVL
jgi:hypothetical protein